MTDSQRPAADPARERLFQRVRQSLAAHRDYRTLRRETRRWAPWAPGCTRALLVETPPARVGLVHLEPGAALPWGSGARAQEVLVTEGRLRAQPSDATPDDARLVAYDLALRSSPAAGEIVATDGPATVYLREMTAALDTLPEPEAAWWRLPRRPLHVVQQSRRRWTATFPGVEVLPLWGSPQIASMLVRFAAGAGVPDHRHAVNEDCLMLQGEMFLGDILLRPGDYQLAPAGGGHFGEMSDVGGAFFFHGAIDPALIPGKRL